MFPAAATLVFTSNVVGVPQRKISSSNSILHAAVGLLSKDSYSIDVKTKILELTSHACQALESRNVLAKVSLLEVLWLEFLNRQ